jgi:predicted amidohydrolase
MQAQSSRPPVQENERMNVALISEVFADDTGPERLVDALRDAASRGAHLALLPELPLNRWSPADQQPHDHDAEPPDGPRHQALATAARTAGIGVIGGAIVRDTATGARHNTALVFAADGTLVATYRKVHLPEEEGFWETRHYEPGDTLSPIVRAFDVPIGLQICSDANRPEGCHLLGAMGAHAILNPRATEAATYARWRTVLLANALTSGAYVLSVNRPRPELGVGLGGPSFAAAPTGEVLAETTDAIAIVSIDPRVVQEARSRYPGYLATRADLYTDGWRQVATTRLPHQRA